MKLYKLTTQDHKTRRGFPEETYWYTGKTLETDGVGELCSKSFVHAYTHPILAVLLNPIHANIVNPILWECEGDIVKSDKGLKVGTTKLTTIKIIPLPVITTEQKVKFAILCALEVYPNSKFKQWAEDWLSGKNRSYAAADAAAACAANAAAHTASAAARAAAARAARATDAAAAAARAAADAAAYAAAAARATRAADAAYAATRAAYATARAAYAATDAYADFDLIKLAEQAME